MNSPLTTDVVLTKQEATVSDNSEDDSNLPLKKRPRSEEPSNKTENTLISLGNFEFVEVLRELSDSKSIFLKAKSKTIREDAIVILEKEAFGEENSKKILSDATLLKNILINDVYGTYIGVPPPDVNAIKVTVIYPATEKHIEKYSTKQMCLVVETYNLYLTIVKPFLQKNSFSHQWVYNILNHETESERIIYEDPNPETGFMLIPDMKWSGKDLSNLYILALSFTKNVTSLRDLTREYLPLLKNIKEKTMKTIEEKYGIPESSIRAYIHYQPSYYHFHVHFNLIGNNVPGSQTEKAHQLQTVISNIENFPDYYQKITLAYALPADSALYKEISSNN